jgi:gluconate 2-dehydrogenase gamma chain
MSMSDSEIKSTARRIAEQRIDRRTFLQGTGAAVAAGAMLHSTSAQDATPAAGTPSASTPTAAGTPEVMAGMAISTTERPAAFFSIHEAATVDALASRLIPGDESDPGAHEAGVVFFIDRTLAGTNLGYDLKTYTQGPFPVTEEAQTPVESSSAPDSYRAVFISSDNISRYGFQSILSPQDMYRRGIEFLDAHTNAKYQNDFVDLDESQQDETITALQQDKAEEFTGPSGAAFFSVIRNDVIKGMFSDPMYGGNMGKVGWSLIGYPGAQRLYTSEDLTNTSFSRPPQSLAEMMAAEGH